jgi:CHAT domain-containing protein/tetratricopeptide (TPR) repeat protein
LSGALVLLLALSACATTEERRFPLTYLAGQEAALRTETAREALPYYQRVASELERQGRSDEATIAYANAAVTARALGRLQESLDAALKGVETAERIKRPGYLTVALLHLGNTYLQLNAPQKAIPAFERAVARAKESAAPPLEAMGYAGLSSSHRRLKRPDLAAQNGTKAVEILKGILQRAGAGRFGERGRRILARLEQNYVHAVMDLGRDYLSLRQWEPAREAFQKALESAERMGVTNQIAQARQGLGIVAARQGDLQAAAEHLGAAISLSSNPNLTAGTQARLGALYRRMRRLPEAERVLRQAVAGIEDMRSLLQSEELREGFVEDKMEAYANLIQVLFDQRKFAEAFNFSERARARAFLDLLGNRVRLSKGVSAALVAEEKTLQERIAHLKAQQATPEDDEESPEETFRYRQGALQRELDLARESYSAFLARVRAQSREQASLMTVEPLSVPEVQALLGPEAVLVEYFVGGGRTLVWVVSRNGLRAFRLRIEEAELTKRVSEFRDLLASRGRLEELRDAAHDLYKTLLAPAFAAGSPRELIIVPHRVLHYLPFHTLMPTPGRYLLQDSLVYYLSSASLMQFTREKEQAVAAATLAVGNPDLEDPTLNLRYAEREVREVERLFPGATVLVRREATKGQTRRHMTAQSLIHLATHADLDGDDPLGSALLLRPEGSDTGRLEVQEVFGLDLHASLVILSACDTSLGKVTEGDEVVGLTRAFVYAGTPSVISTLWRVDDRASYELMRAFYENLRAGATKGDSLRQAQLATLEKYPHPYYWAAYQLTGEAR